MSKENEPENDLDLSVSMMISSAADLSELMSGRSDKTIVSGSETMTVPASTSSVNYVLEVLLAESRLHVRNELKRVHGKGESAYSIPGEQDLQTRATMEAIAFNDKARQAHDDGDIEGLFFHTAQLISAVIRSRAYQTYRKGQKFKPGKPKGALSKTNTYLLGLMREHPNLSNKGIANLVWKDESPDSPYLLDERELEKKDNLERISMGQLIEAIEQVRSRHFSDK